MRQIPCALLILVSVAFCMPAWGWSVGHVLLTKVAVQALPADVPFFFRAGWKFVAHGVLDPDVFRRSGLAQLKNAESPEHFFNLEYLAGHPIPLTRFEFIKLCIELGVDPKRVGFVPYATAEWTQRLTVAFAEHRQWPDNPMIQNKCLIYAGILAHYAEDMCQPLHLTIHFDGRVGSDGKKLNKGIHRQVDGLIDKLNFQAEDLVPKLQPEPVEDLMQDILYRIVQGNARVDQVYALATALKGPLYPDEVRGFAQERALDAAEFTASLFLTAWRDSEKVKLPDWLAP